MIPSVSRKFLHGEVSSKVLLEVVDDELDDFVMLGIRSVGLTVLLQVA